MTGDSLVWPNKLTRNNLKQNLKFHLVGHRWDFTVTRLVVPNIIANDKLEYTLLFRLDHLLSFLGPLFVVVEYAAHGDLRQFLQDRRPVLEYEPGSQSPEVLVLQDLLSFCYQVAKGMEFLSSRKVHIYSHEYREFTPRSLEISDHLAWHLVLFVP